MGSDERRSEGRQDCFFNRRAGDAIADREPITIHTEDAARFGIANGDLVRVWNKVYIEKYTGNAPKLTAFDQPAVQA
ncbi:hypothetical protein AWJ24_24415 [Escherichia coli]|nr:hypothetical protein AWJ24_24415 [Escherichia coli]